jgi:DNA-binding CsgD family transcriptional regulator
VKNHSFELIGKLTDLILGAEEIVLDVLIDGSRYLLVRLPKPIEVPARLSPREQEIVRLVAQGHSNKIIGDVLNISSWTVCTHLRRIFAKIGVGSRAAMVARLLGNGVAHATRSDRKTAGEPPDEVTVAPASKRSSVLSEPRL